MKATPIQQRFESKVTLIPFSDCHFWDAAQTKFGYGKLSSGKNKWVLAHKFSFEKAKGNVPEGMFVLHTCDNPSCVNPEHLYIGTSKDNAQDRESRKRGNHAFGERHGRSKLSVDLVYKIREEYGTGKFSFRQLGKIYNVDGKTVADIVRNKLWQCLH